MKLKCRNAFFLLCLWSILHTQISIAQCGTAGAQGALSVTAANTIVNSYYPSPSTGTYAVPAGATTITVGARDTRGAATTLAVGQTIVIMQMQGSDIDASNSNLYGDGVASNPANGYTGNNHIAGRFEYNVVSGFNSSTGVITLQYGLTLAYGSRPWSSGTGKQAYQVIIVPRFTTISITGSGSITAPAWDPAIGAGGVVILEASGAATISSNPAITVAGLGFRGGGGKGFNSNSAGGSNTDYRVFSRVSNGLAGFSGAKGEGIAGTPAYTFNAATPATVQGSAEGYTNGAMGRGAPGNAGGGGTDGSTSTNEFNTGGGGGGNGGVGGQGGSGWHGGSGSSATYPYGGNGGSVFAERSISRIVMGGGGGAGTANNYNANALEYKTSGGAGGGIIIIRAASYSGSGTLNADGAAAPGIASSDLTDAAGGGGAGGSVIAVTNQGSLPNMSSLVITARGGAGGNMFSYHDHGPGGGGGGGVIVSGNSISPSSSVAGGANGLTNISGGGTQAYNATAGSAGAAIVLTTVPLFNSTGGNSAACGVLPVNLVAFNGLLRNNEVQLRWETAMETRFSHFEVEYSQDGTSFTAIGKVTATGGPQYQFTHAQASSLNYYRLRLVDTDGGYTLSNVVTVRANATSSFSVTPLQNPVRFDIVARVESDVEEMGYYRIFAPNGALINQKNLNIQKGFSIVMFDDKGNRTSGVYMIEIVTPSRTARVRVIRTN